MHPIVIIGAGFAGASTAAALARAGAGPGVILEREPLPGAHASGKNAAIARLFEFDPVVRCLALASTRPVRQMETPAGSPLRQTGGIYLGAEADGARFAACARALITAAAPAEVLGRQAAIARSPFLSGFRFDLAARSALEGTLDIHALLHAYLDEARRGRFALLTRTEALDVEVARGRVKRVLTARGPIRAEVVVDASGAWAGRLGRRRPLPLTALRRHLFVLGGASALPGDAPVIWDVASGYYLRPEGAGLLASPCDERPQAAGVPAVDPAAAELLAAKLGACAPALLDLDLRSAWACLRTFAPDRRPVIGWDPDVEGLFHVAGLGGSGAGASWAVGEVAAALLLQAPVPFIEPIDLRPGRACLRAAPASRSSPT